MENSFKISKKEFLEKANKHLFIDEKQNMPFGKTHHYINGIEEFYKSLGK